MNNKILSIIIVVYSSIAIPAHISSDDGQGRDIDLYPFVWTNIKQEPQAKPKIKKSGKYPNYRYTLPDGSHVERDGENYFSENLLDIIPQKCTEEDYTKIEEQFNLQEKEPGALTKSATKKASNKPFPS